MSKKAVEQFEEFQTPEGLTACTVESKFIALHGDNFAWVPDKSVDLILTDPPFNIAQDTNFHTWDQNTINSYRFDQDKGWDTYDHDQFLAMLQSWADGFARVLKPGGNFAIFCADAYVSHLMEALTNAKLKPRRLVTWQKPNAVPINRQSMMMSACEYVIVGVKGSKATFNSDIGIDDLETLSDVSSILLADKAGRVVEKAVREAITAAYAEGKQITPDKIAKIVSTAVSANAAEVAKRTRAMYVENTDTKTEYLRACVPNYVSMSSKAGSARLHPTEKPVPLLRYFASLLSKPGDVILDPFGGSGSTGQASIETGRKVVVIEADENYYKGIANRLQQAVIDQEAPATEPAPKKATKRTAKDESQSDDGTLF